MGIKGKILIVDDDVDTVELLRKRLRHEGYDTAEAYDGEECLERVDEYKPDLIVLDILMPKLDGFAVCERLKAKEETGYTPILMLTAKGDVESRIKGLDIGADDYIPKPFAYAELSARVRSLLSRKETRERLAEERKSEALGHMIDQLTHEIRNPLVSIGGFAKRAYKSLPDGDTNKKYMEMIIHEAERLESMMEKLIELKSINVCHLYQTDVNYVIDETISDFKDIIKDEKIDISIDLNDHLPSVSADKKQLKTALTNLVKNSIEAMDDHDKRLKIHSSAGNGYVQIEISDSGRGISKDKLKDIFNPFFTSKVYGPGLGLTLALRIIEAHGGTMSVESEPGTGATFTIRLPVK